MAKFDHFHYIALNVIRIFSFFCEWVEYQKILLVQVWFKKSISLSSVGVIVN